jgi:hypothetical protein
MLIRPDHADVFWSLKPGLMGGEELSSSAEVSGTPGNRYAFTASERADLAGSSSLMGAGNRQMDRDGWRVTKLSTTSFLGIKAESAT